LIILGRGRLREQWTDVDGQRMFARVSTVPPRRAEPPVVLVHGLGVSSRYMVPLAEQLSEFYPVWAPDLPGHGRSSRPQHVLDIRQLAAALHKWMQGIGIERGVLIGNSMGCQVIVELADLAPECISAAVLLGPTMDPSGGVVGQVRRLFMDQFREPVSLIPLQAFDYLGNGPIRTVMTFRKALRQDMIERAARLVAPTLILRGEHDPIVTDWFVRELTERRWPPVYTPSSKRCDGDEEGSGRSVAGARRAAGSKCLFAVFCCKSLHCRL
jgi:2-hydroxy-6-oxonona-2,4-dienedioate hydrolase